MNGNSVPSQDVLIVGAGTVGLAAAVFLAHHGVRALVIEREPGPQVHPRATGIGPRTMEFLREVGLAEAVNAVAIDAKNGSLGKISVETLASADFTTMRPSAQVFASPPAYTPGVVRGTCPQNRLDSVLLSRTSVTCDTHLVSLDQDAEGVTALLSGPDGPYEVRARYVIGADGVRSTVRTALGIDTSGPGAVGQRTNNVLFHADLRPIVGDARFAACDITTPDSLGMIVTIDGEKEWVFHTTGDASHAADLVRGAIGDPSVEAQIVSVLPWRPRAQVADSFSAGRVFLVGDAAHAVPPLGAFGLNTGVADAHNLAWKLAYVLRGEAGPGLLDTYGSERRPVAVMTMEQSLLRLSDPRLHWARGMTAERARVGAINAPVVHMGYRYGTPMSALPSTEDLELNLDGSVGSRVPHLWVADGVSSLDLVGSRFTVLADAGDPVWATADAQLIGGWPYGPLLVRPDGIVAWKATTPDALPAVMNDLLCR